MPTWISKLEIILIICLNSTKMYKIVTVIYYNVFMTGKNCNPVKNA